MSYIVTKVMKTETAHRLMDYKGKCAHIHGHSYRWEVDVALRGGGLEKNDIAVDFADIKSAMKTEIYDTYDHALVLCERDPLVAEGMPKGLMYAADGQMQKIVLEKGNPTAEYFAALMFARLDDILRPQEAVVHKVRVWETANSYAEYSPGLIDW